VILSDTVFSGRYTYSRASLNFWVSLWCCWTQWIPFFYGVIWPITFLLFAQNYKI